MGLWNNFLLKNNFNKINKGISLIFDNSIEINLKKEYISFVKWLRKNYIFPIHINVYVLNREKIKLKNGSLAYGSFRWFPKRNPLIKIPSKINYDYYNDCSKKEIYESVLSSLVHELTHYYQWIKNLEQSDFNSERQADYYRFKILENYYNDIKKLK